MSKPEASRRHLPQQPQNLLFRPLQIRVNLFERARRRVFIEVPVEVDLVANLILRAVHPSIWNVRFQFALEIGINVLFERDILEIAQVRIGLIAAAPALCRYWLRVGIAFSERLAEALLFRGFPPYAALVQDILNLLPDGAPVLPRLRTQRGFNSRNIVREFGEILQKLFLTFGRDPEAQAERPLDGHACIAEIRVVEDLRTLFILEAAIEADNLVNLCGGEMPALVAQAALGFLTPAWRPDIASVDELNLPFAPFLLTVGDNPDVGADAGVVKHLLRQGNDRLEPVVLDDPFPDIALARARAPGEQRGAAEDDGQA